MHAIDDKPNGITINYSPDWSGEARIAWYASNAMSEALSLPGSTHECWCNGSDLVAGRFTCLSGIEPPINVLTRAVALAVETYLRGKLERLLDRDLFVRRSKL